MNTDVNNQAQNRAVAMWLLICCGLVFVMVVLGGFTRLTGSGLSMVDWRPLMGFLPPMSDAEWQRVFEMYQQSPEFQKVNSAFGVEEFKDIFWLEYLHRLLGRLEITTPQRIDKLVGGAGRRVFQPAHRVL